MDTKPTGDATLFPPTIRAGQRHQEFFLETLYFEASVDFSINWHGPLRLSQVESTVFKIPQRNLQQSKLFQDLFRLPAANDIYGNVEGSSEADPIRLHDIAKEDFESFLMVLCPL